MTAMAVVGPMTAEQFLARPEHEHRWTELVGGELVVDPQLLRHQLICSEILHELISWTRDGTLTSALLSGFALKLGAVFGE